MISITDKTLQDLQFPTVLETIEPKLLLLAQRLLSFLDFTARLERTAVTPITLLVAGGDLPVKIPKEVRQYADVVCIDEAKHAFESVRLEAVIVDQTSGARLAGYRQTVRLWRGRPVVEIESELDIQQLPDGFLEGVFMGAVNRLLRGETDGGTSRLEGGLKRALERVRDTWIEVEKIGAKYGAAL